MLPKYCFPDISKGGIKRCLFIKGVFCIWQGNGQKSVLLLLIFLFVNSMILSTNMIYTPPKGQKLPCRKKAGAKVVCEIMNTTHPITDTRS